MPSFKYRPILYVGYRYAGIMACFMVGIPAIGYFQRKKAMRLIRSQNRIREIQEMETLHRDLVFSSNSDKMFQGKYKLILSTSTTNLPQLKRVW